MITIPEPEHVECSTDGKEVDVLLPAPLKHCPSPYFSHVHLHTFLSA